VLQVLTSLFIPFVILGLAFIAFPETEQLPANQLAVLAWLPVAFALVILGLCLRFNRSRVLFSVLSVSLAYVILQWYLPAADAVAADIVWAGLCVLLPVNLAVFSMLKERGMLTWWGCTRLALLVLPMLLVYATAQVCPEPFQQLVSTRLLEQNMASGVYIYQGPMLVILVAIMMLNGRVFAQTTAQNSSLFVALLASIVMLHYWNDTAAKAVFASAALLMMGIAVIHESWSMAYVDQLTNLPGRRALEEEMLKLGGTFSIAMLDIDHFKKFNDQYGHDAGDEILRMVASFIGNAAAGSKAFRYGGEEFTLVFPGKKAKDTIEALEELRDIIAESTFQLRSKDRRKGATRRKQGGKNVRVTISIGVAERSAQLSTPHNVIKSADRALYRAKKQGRNCVCR